MQFAGDGRTFLEHRQTAVVQLTRHAFDAAPDGLGKRQTEVGLPFFQRLGMKAEFEHAGLRGGFGKRHRLNDDAVHAVPAAALRQHVRRLAGPHAHAGAFGLHQTAGFVQNCAEAFRLEALPVADRLTDTAQELKTFVAAVEIAGLARHFRFKVAVEASQLVDHVVEG